MIYRILSLPVILAALVAIFMTPVMVMADGGAAAGNAQTVPAENSVEGTLTVMESYGHILIKPEVGNLARLKLRPATVISRNGKPAKLSDLRVGDKVRATYDSKNWVSELHATGR